ESGTDGKVKWKSFDTSINLYRERSGWTGFNKGDADGKSGEVYGTDTNGREISYEGWRDVFGKIRVRQWTSESKYMFRRGWIEEVPARVKGEHSGFFTARWEKGYYRKNTTGIEEAISGNLLDPIK